MLDPTDESLLTRMVAGDATALGALFDRHAPLVNGLARRILRDGGEAEDVVQDVFVQVWRDAARFDRGRGSVQAWICIIARSRAVDRLRRRRSRREDGDTAPPAPPAPHRTGDDAPVIAATVRRALDGLPVEQRQPLELAYYEGLTQVEIAERLGEPLGTIKTRMRTALLRLRDHLAAP
jgi:RNA polymerase sigma-70 factor (ECF subfamily)